jgi:hypothetical protein
MVAGAAATAWGRRAAAPDTTAGEQLPAVVRRAAAGRHPRFPAGHGGNPARAVSTGGRARRLYDSSIFPELQIKLRQLTASVTLIDDLGAPSSSGSKK